MKTVIYFLLTAIISAFAGFGAMASKDTLTIIICLGIGLLVWALFFWGWIRRIKQASAKRFREQIFADYVRS